MAYEYELSNHKNSEEIHLQLCRNTLYIYTYVFAEKYISGGGQKAATHAGKVRRESCGRRHVVRNKARDT
jgi:hypothetical protein